jgi:hypothetical protein
VIARYPFLFLARATCAIERIPDSTALAQVGVVNTAWAKVHPSRLQLENSVFCKRDENTRSLPQTIEKKNSRPPLHVDIMYAKTVQGLWPRELNVWTKYRHRFRQRPKNVFRNYKIHIHCHDVELQFGTLVWATTKAEKMNKDASNAAIRRAISCPTAMQMGRISNVSFWRIARGPSSW